MGAPPPTRMAPMDTCTEERRVLLMGMRPCVVRILPLPAIMPQPESVCSERVRREPERRRRKFRPETLRHQNGRRRNGTLPRGFWRAVDFDSTHRRGAALTAPDLSGHRTEGRQAPWPEGVAPAAFFVWRRGPVGRHTPLFKLHQELGARIVDFGGW